MTGEKKMKAAVLAGEKQIEMKELPVPELKAGEIEIAVSACGVCGSDIHMWKTGKSWNPELADFVMGHEFCGVVTNPGDSDFSIGDRVVFWANMYCGECDMCKAGKEQLCRQVNGQNYIGFVRNGAYAEKFVWRASNAYKLPDTVSDTAAGLIDPLMVAYHALRISDLKLHDKVLVVGSGIIGQLTGGLVKKAGASYLAMAKRNDRKLGLAKEIGDFDDYFDSSASDSGAIMNQAANGGFDVVFECVGTEESLAASIDAVKPGGTIVTVGNSINDTVQISLNKIVLREIRLMGSVSCTRKEFEETIDIIASGMIDADKYVTDVMKLDELQHAFERLTSKTDPVVKIVVKP
ncbi:MAG: alcohol dehydrogenase catalytic domain-containing protein [Clostridiales Family XIII bacterium]|nr:alcohol dehydrogenase catalytic domain-containing protein [Clostridia bacterium]MDY3010528.1 alcohol dehydrogenase catalytic domain-containing protein [Clostridiales Family XIII bacterium]